MTQTKTRIDQHCLELVRTSSFTGEEAAAIDLVTSWLSDRADVVERWTDDMSAIETDPAYPGREVERSEIPVVAARVQGTRPGPIVVLTGHVDVVPIGDPDTWTRDPTGEISGDLLYGRGACDMKAGLVAALEAFNHFADGERDFAGSVCFVAVPGEEDGGTGTLSAIRRGWSGDHVIVTEPTSGPDGPRIVAAHGGALTFTIAIEGRAAHAATRTEGESAVDHFITVYEALRRIETELNETETDPLMTALGLPYPTTVGIISGGEWASNVMDHLSIDIRVGVRIDETIAEAERRFERTLREAIAGDPWLAEHPPSTKRTGAAFGSSRLSTDHPLVSAVSEASQVVTGRTPPIVGAPYGCDMALWIREGGAAALVYGPGDVSHAHAPDERVNLTEVHEVTQTLVEAVNRLLR